MADIKIKNIRKVFEKVGIVVAYKGRIHKGRVSHEIVSREQDAPYDVLLREIILKFCHALIVFYPAALKSEKSKRTQIWENRSEYIDTGIADIGLDISELFRGPVCRKAKELKAAVDISIRSGLAYGVNASDAEPG